MINLSQRTWIEITDGGEHATTVNGNGVNRGMEDILAVAKGIGLNSAKAKKTAANIKECVAEMLVPTLA